MENITKALIQISGVTFDLIFPALSKELTLDEFTFGDKSYLLMVDDNHILDPQDVGHVKDHENEEVSGDYNDVYITTVEGENIQAAVFENTEYISTRSSADFILINGQGYFLEEDDDDEYEYDGDDEDDDWESDDDNNENPFDDSEENPEDTNDEADPEDFEEFDASDL
jgi:hypothetical protein